MALAGCVLGNACDCNAHGLVEGEGEGEGGERGREGWLIGLQCYFLK